MAADEQQHPQPSETTQLLPSPSSPPSLSTSSLPSPLRSIIAAFTIHLLLNTATNLALAPQTAILRDIVCKQYYDGVGVGVGAGSRSDTTSPGLDRCSVAPVQSEVAYVIGWEAAIENIPNMLLAVPFGALADRVGRKKILLLAIVGMFMNDVWIRLVYWFPHIFPVRAVWIAGLWQSFGSGAATLSSITHALVADACPEEQRTFAFSQIRSAKLLSQLIFVPVGGALISLNPWIPMFISTGVFICGFLAAILLVPSDWPPSPSGRRSHRESQGLLDGQDVPQDDDDDDDDDDKSSWLSRRGIAATFSVLTDWAVENSRLLPLVLSFFVFQLGEQAGLTLMLQYAAKRLSWTFSKASLLISIRAGVNMAALVVLLPAISTLLTTRHRLSVLKKDKRLALASGLLLVLGCAIVFQAVSSVSMVTGLVLISLGDVFAIPVRSLATGLVHPRHLAVLYTVIEVMTQSGLFIGQPMLAGAFRWGLNLGDVWLGLPFLFAATFFLLAFIAVSSVPSRRSVVGEGVLEDVDS
ncbi:hypothetical protein QQS21_006024 [Conoideocrella luteorostrata]|uniref:Major facilitator superfamily (MFS) profile domain-containing protein n=1 Tax=Conoideocrella luteorostrata TaxID=1105319 RepID=A0AAJ0CNK5_9HYPO|nr:hypothetical protein QQS21_006024 [Conoideocrella luteorostrata]